MTERLRAVFDTNVFLSAHLSRNPTSPTQELIDRWLAGEFTLLVCDAIVDELIEKLVERRIARSDIEAKGVRITKALPFLWAVRGDRPPTATT